MLICTCGFGDRAAIAQRQAEREALEAARDRYLQDALAFERDCVELRAERNALREALLATLRHINGGHPLGRCDAVTKRLRKLLEENR